MSFWIQIELEMKLMPEKPLKKINFPVPRNINVSGGR